MATAKVFTVKRAARKGRPISADTVKAFGILDKRWSTKSDRATVNIEDAEGKVIDTFPALVVEPTDIGKPATYTGLTQLVNNWAKSKGHKVRTVKVSDTHIAIRSLSESKK